MLVRAEPPADTRTEPHANAATSTPSRTMYERARAHTRSRRLLAAEHLTWARQAGQKS